MIEGDPVPSRRIKPLKAHRSHEKVRQVRCQICGCVTRPGVDLGPQPIADFLLSPGRLNYAETHYPLQLYHCDDCGLTQLGFIVDPRIVYKHFMFVSGTTRTATEHLQTLPVQLLRMLGGVSDVLAVDIGSNDGTLLKAYRNRGVRFLGVDPAEEAVLLADAEGIPTVHAFFDEHIAGEIVAAHGQAAAISACGIFGHVANLTGFMQGLKKLLAPRGIFAADSQYWLDTMLRGHYDNIFHEHLRYYSMKPLARLLEHYDMAIFDVERSEVYGGSFRIFAGHAGEHEVSPRVEALMKLETDARIYDEAQHRKFADETALRRRNLSDSVMRVVRDGKKVIGIGAPAKASTVCNFCRLGPESLEYITEVNRFRIGKFLPGVRIPVVDEARMFDDSPPPDAAVLFAWNYHDEIVPRLRQRGYAGQIILP